jgi:hypothetical protein
MGDDAIFIDSNNQAWRMSTSIMMFSSENVARHQPFKAIFPTKVLKLNFFFIFGHLDASPREINNMGRTRGSAPRFKDGLCRKPSAH